MRERLINRRQQGDLGEASAIEWLTRMGTTVLIPFGHSPDYDLVADFDGRLLRIQVKTSTYMTSQGDGRSRYGVQIATNGGNQSWTGVAKKFDPERADYVFALVGDGRQWFIPAAVIEGATNITLGGRKYSEYEIDPGRAISDLVYGEASFVESDHRPGECPSGQRKHTVNVPAYAYAGSNPASPILDVDGQNHARPKYERSLGRSGQAVIWTKRRLTIPLRAFDAAHFHVGDRVRAWSEGDGRLVLERIAPPPELTLLASYGDGEPERKPRRP